MLQILLTESGGRAGRVLKVLTLAGPFVLDSFVLDSFVLDSFVESSP